jgi:hypothetical protein
MKAEGLHLACWEFQRADQGGSEAWQWSRFDDSGKKISTSVKCTTFGKCMTDAIKNGFRPNLDQWAIRTDHGTQHFPLSARPEPPNFRRLKYTVRHAKPLPKPDKD